MDELSLVRFCRTFGNLLLASLIAQKEMGLGLHIIIRQD